MFYVTDARYISARNIGLTDLPLDKMATISQTIFQMHFREWKALYFDWKFIKFVPNDPVYLFGAKPLSEPMLTQFTDAYMRQ